MDVDTADSWGGFQITIYHGRQHKQVPYGQADYQKVLVEVGGCVGRPSLIFVEKSPGPPSTLQDSERGKLRESETHISTSYLGLPLTQQLGLKFDNNTISELSSLHDEDSNFRQSFHQMRNKQFPVSGDLESNPDYWSGVMGGSSGASRGPSAMEYNKEDRESFRHR
ncbi:hypothetical protein P7K49_037753 [Saguinus oedipus]|uniref:Uncharacterized protein n=1 Tax=Saguinus oedipus TaxID=9490 RepID=A0ABQ9TJF4_SAGOE|nr:hypothetical protein P7K49_037753 [Saguinus oedipus]